MELALRNPIVFFDLETTGINIASDRIVELSYIKVHPDGHEDARTLRINPTIPIPPAATEIHGITDEDVRQCHTFKQVAADIVHVFEGADLAGYNSNKFDLPLLAEEFMRAGVDFDIRKRKFIDVQVIFHKMEQRTLSAAYKFYCNSTLENAHSSQADTRATYEVLKAQLDRYSNVLHNDIDSLSAFSSQTSNADLAGRIIYNDARKEVFNFGKYKGQLVTDVLRKDPSYYAWMMNGDFPLYTKKVLTAIKIRMAQE